MQGQSIVSELVAEAYPVAVSVSPGRIRRNWIVRAASILPSDEALDAIARKLTEDTHAAIDAAYAEVASATELENARPAVTLLRLDDLHLVVRTEYADPEHAIGDSDAISQWGVLQRLDVQVELADVQGIPRSLWFPLRQRALGAP